MKDKAKEILGKLDKSQVFSNTYKEIALEAMLEFARLACEEQIKFTEDSAYIRQLDNDYREVCFKEYKNICDL